MSNELVSIITPVYNGEKYVSMTIDSVLRQSYSNWEMVIIDDGSTDDSVGIISNYVNTDHRIRLHKQKNSGSASARNTGLKYARGRYVCFLDSDDIWMPDMLLQQVGLLQASNVGLVYASYIKIDQSGNEIYRPVIVPDKLTYADLLKKNSISCLTAMYDTQIVGVPLFDESLKSMRDDYAYWLSILKRIPYAQGNKKIIGAYRVYLSSTTGNKKRLIKPTFLFYYNYLKLGMIRSLYYTFTWGISGLKRYS